MFEDTVSVLLNTTISGSQTASFLSQQKFATGSGPRGVTLADINGDGKLDVLTSNSGGNTISVLLNTTTAGGSTASFSPKVEFVAATSGVSGVHAIDTADINGDGRPDVAVTLQSGSRVSVLLNTTLPGSGTLSFSPRVELVTQQYPWRLELADVTDDGKPDIVVNYADNYVEIHAFSVFPNITPIGATTPSFAAREDWATGTTGTWPALAVGDINGDGLMDVATGEPTGVFINTHRTAPLQQPYTNFATRQSLGVSTAYLGAACIVDLNGDGKSEVAVTGAGSLNVLQNRGTPFGTPLGIGQTTQVPLSGNPTSLTTADFNSDGRPDLAAIDHGNGFVNVLLNTTPGRTSLPQFVGSAQVTPSEPHAATPADLNADGKPDLIVASQSSGVVSVLVNSSTPGMASPLFLTHQDFLTGPLCVWTSIADFNQDGKPDVVAANAGNNTVSVLLNATAPQSNSIALAAKADFLTGNRPRMVATADFNLDGKPDIVTPNSWAGTISILVNATTPGSSSVAFSSKQDFLSGLGAVSVAVGDLNGDGRPDLVVANETDNTVSVLMNSTTPGSSTLAFTATQNFAVGTGPRSVTLGDINADGKLDIATANHGTEAGTTASVLLNTTTPGAGTPSFAVQQVFTAGAGPIAIAAGDISGDGRVDLVVNNFIGDSVSLLRNTTSPGSSVVSFDTAVNIAAGDGPIFVALADLSLDGRPDIAVANYNGACVTVLSNTPVSVSQATATVTIIDDDATPQVTSSFFKFETAPQQIQLTFNKNVGPSIDLNDLSIVRLKDNVHLAPIAVSYDAATNTAKWNLPAILDDGNYLAVLDGALVSDSVGRTLSGPVTHPFYILLGDANRDRKTNTLDFNILAYNFGLSSGAIFSKGDFNLDTQIDSLDFGIFLAHYGIVIPAPGPLPSAMSTGQSVSGRPLFAVGPVAAPTDIDELLAVTV